MKSEILGTGLNGLVGSRIVEILSSDFDFIDFPISEGLDITKPETIENKISSSQADAFIHLAAFTDVNAAWKEKENKNGPCYKINVIGTKNVAELCKKYNKYLIHFSTDFVFDGNKLPRSKLARYSGTSPEKFDSLSPSFPQNAGYSASRNKDIPYTEEDNPSPIEWYGKTKYLAEEAVRNSGVKHCIVRIAFPFRSVFQPKSDLVRKLIDGLKNKTLYPQFTDQIITPTFIDDIANGIKIILERKPEGIFHLTGSSFVSPFDLAQKVAEVFGFNKSLVKEGSLAHYLANNPGIRPYQKNMLMSNKKVKEILGCKMKTIGEALLEMVNQVNQAGSSL